jgi:hypothetical protein
MAFSRAEDGLGPGMPLDTLELEFRRSMSHHALTDSVYVGDIPVRHFPEHRQAVLEELVRFGHRPPCRSSHRGSDRLKYENRFSYEHRQARLRFRDG